MASVASEAGTSRPPQALEGLEEVRRRLVAPSSNVSVLPLLGASALLALSAFMLASSIILGPFWQTKNPPALAAAEARALR